MSRFDEKYIKELNDREWKRIINESKNDDTIVGHFSKDMIPKVMKITQEKRDKKDSKNG